MEIPTQVCKRCVLDSTIPGISFDGEGVCNVCNEFDSYNEPLLDANGKAIRDPVAYVGAMQQRQGGVCLSFPDAPRET